MKNIIIGTAGHIDHGKTALVKVLTGIDTDRFPEEKSRGLTIDIGFAFFDITKEIRVNFIDVPGHERFVKNMLAGATSVSAALLIIAADDGIMPQTREHLEIIDLLEINHIIVVITKCDLVEQDWLEMLEEDIKKFISNTKFKNARILPVSAIKKQGLDELKIALIDLITGINADNNREVFRLPIDRAFTIPGFGCVVTGSVIGGKISVNDEVDLLPNKTSVRIRGIEVNGSKQNCAYKGERAAINLAGIKSSDVYRGCELATLGKLIPSQIIDCELLLHYSAKKNLANRTRIRFHIYTSEIIGRVILLNKDILKPGECALVQIRLEKPIVAERDDRYIIRSYSPAYTIGGGRLLRLNTHHLKRFKKDVLMHLETLAGNNIDDIIELTFAESKSYCLSIKDIQQSINIPEQNIKDVITKLVESRKLFVIKAQEYSKTNFIHYKHLEKLQKQIEWCLKQFHGKNPLKSGIDFTILKSNIDHELSDELYSFLISTLLNKKNIKSVNNRLSLYYFNPEISGSEKKLLQFIEDIINKEGFSPPPKDQIISKVNGEKKQIESLFAFLVEVGKIVEVSENLYYHDNVLNQLKNSVSNYIEKNSSISVAEFRNITNTSRKYIIPLLEYFDKIHFTKRTGDKRVLF